MKNMNETVTVGLIKGRHTMPVTDYIFDGEVNPLDFAAMETTIYEFLKSKVGICIDCGEGINQYEDAWIDIIRGEHDLVVYVTGLTAVTAMLIKLCAMNGVSLTLMHYDRETDSYVPQVIFDQSDFE